MAISGLPGISGNTGLSTSPGVSLFTGLSGNFITKQFNFLNSVLPSDITFTRAAGSQSNYNSAGIIVYPGTNIPRFDYNPTTLILNGLYDEEARTNSLKSSATIGDANWTNQAQNVAQASGISPDGTNTAVLLTTTINTFPDSQQSVGSSASGNYAVSVFVKQGTNAAVWISLSDNIANSAGALFTFLGTTFTNGVAGNGSVVGTPSAQVLPNGWYRLKVVLNFSGAGAANFNLTVGPWNDTSGNSTVNNTVLVWGAQAENGQIFVSSYIPTTASSATRAVENSLVSSIPWFNAKNGTILCNFISEGFSGTLGKNFFFSDGTSNNAIDFSILSNSQANITVTGSGFNSNNIATPVNATNKFGLSYVSGANIVSANGATIGASAFGTSLLPAGIIQLNIGNRPDGARPVNGWIQLLNFYNYNFTQAQLNAATT